MGARGSRRLGALLALVGAAGVALTGCGSSRDATAERTADRFYAALADRDGTTACDLLAAATRSELERSSGRACAEAILEEDLRRPAATEDVEVFGRTGQVRYDVGATFLSEFAEGWKVTATGCALQGRRPYECTLSGG